MQLTNLKEQKLPKYEKGVPWTSWQNKYLAASIGRSKAIECLTGEILKEMRDTTLEDIKRKANEDENKRAYADLINSMPNGRLTYCLADSKSDFFDKGCAATAWNNLKIEITEMTETDKEILKTE